MISDIRYVRANPDLTKDIISSLYSLRDLNSLYNAQQIKRLNTCLARVVHVIFLFVDVGSIFRLVFVNATVV